MRLWICAPANIISSTKQHRVHRPRLAETLLVGIQREPSTTTKGGPASWVTNVIPLVIHLNRPSWKPYQQAMLLKLSFNSLKIRRINYKHLPNDTFAVLWSCFS